MMTLGNMRENRVRSLWVRCGALGCHHDAVIDVTAFPDDATVPSFGPRGYRPEPRPILWRLRMEHDATDGPAVLVKDLVVVCWIAGKTCSPEIEWHS
jgi:hypothetical protein